MSDATPTRLASCLLAAALLLAACGNAAAAAPTPQPTAIPTSTPYDPCAADNLSAEVRVIHRLMREFDDAFTLAANTTRDQLTGSIAELQRIRRAAEDVEAPSCLMSLKELQLVYMNTVIQTMLAFLTAADEQAVNKALAISGQMHSQYMIEMARALGTTPADSAGPASTAASAVTPPSTAGLTPNVPLAINSGSTAVNLRAAPSLDGQQVGTLGEGQGALALGRSADGLWIMVEIPGLPGQTAWLYGPLVQLSGPGDALPIVPGAP